MECERAQGGAGFNDVDAELPRDIVAEFAGADFGNGQAACGDDEGFAGQRADCGLKLVLVVFVGDGFYGCFGFYGDMGGFAFLEQHVDDVLRAFVAKELAQFFTAIILFMPGDAVFFDQCNEIVLRELFKRGFAKMRVLGDIGSGAGMQVCEIAAPAAGNTDFFTDLFRVINEQGFAAALARFNRAYKAGSARANNDGVVMVFVCFHV